MYCAEQKKQLKWYFKQGTAYETYSVLYEDDKFLMVQNNNTKKFSFGVKEDFGSFLGFPVNQSCLSFNEVKQQLQVFIAIDEKYLDELGQIAVDNIERWSNMMFAVIVDQLQDAALIEYKGIVFDEWTVDVKTGGVYGEMCEHCAEKYKDLLANELSEGGVGACSVKGCAIIGAEADTATHYYVDFKPELIRPLSKEQALALEGHASLEDKIADAQAQLSVPDDNRINENIKER